MVMDEEKWRAAVAAAIAAGGDSSDPALALALVTENPAGVFNQHGTTHPQGRGQTRVVATDERKCRWR
jgi:hypothetical protein